jgi:hypothetical protein
MPVHDVDLTKALRPAERDMLLDWFFYHIRYEDRVKLIADHPTLYSKAQGIAAAPVIPWLRNAGENEIRQGSEQFFKPKVVDATTGETLMDGKMP